MHATPDDVTPESEPGPIHDPQDVTPPHGDALAPGTHAPDETSARAARPTENGETDVRRDGMGEPPAEGADRRSP